MAFTADSVRRMLADTTEVRFGGETLTKGDLVAMRAVCRLYASQVAWEKAARTTGEDNNVGFNHAHALIGSLLGDWLDAGRKDGVMRRTTAGTVNKYIYKGQNPQTGKKVWEKINTQFAGRDRREVCHYLANFYAQQLADFANGDRRNVAGKVR